MENFRALLGRWLMREAEAAVILARLGLPEAAAQARKDSACLRGVLRLSEHTLPPPPAMSHTPSRQTDARRLYGESLRLRREYGEQAEDPEFGCVFAELAQHKAARCLALAEWLGRNGG